MKIYEEKIVYCKKELAKSCFISLGCLCVMSVSVMQIYELFANKAIFPMGMFLTMLAVVFAVSFGACFFKHKNSLEENYQKNLDESYSMLLLNIKTFYTSNNKYEIALRESCICLMDQMKKSNTPLVLTRQMLTDLYQTATYKVVVDELDRVSKNVDKITEYYETTNKEINFT